MNTFRSLSHRDYRIWFIGALISNVGTWMQTTAQNWVVLTELTRNDALAVGVTMSLQWGPQLVLAPFTGYIADRFNRRRTLIFTQSAMLLLGLSLGILLITGSAQLWHLYLFAGLLGIVAAIDTPVRQTFVTDLVPTNSMSNAVALNSASFNAARLLGPAVAGLLIGVVGSGWVFIVNAVSFLAVLVALAMLRPTGSGVSRRTSGDGTSLGFVTGIRYVLARPDLVIVFLIVFLIGAFGMNFPIFSSTMAVLFHRGAGEYGLLNSILAIGSLAGALLAARRDRARMRIIIAASALFGIAALICAVMPTFWTFTGATILLGLGTVTILTTANAYVQTTSDPAIRGRVMAFYMAIVAGGTPLGAPIVGAVANDFGARWGLGVAAIAGAIAALVGFGWLILARGMRLRSGGGLMPQLTFEDPPTAAMPAAQLSDETTNPR